MRWRFAAWVAVVAVAGISAGVAVAGIPAVAVAGTPAVAVAGIPAVGDAAPPNGTPMLRVSVTPRTGSIHTHFAISFRAAATTGPTAVGRRAYSVTARGPNSGGCQWSATVEAPPSRAGTHVRVVLSPHRASGWCAGTFHGMVWDVVTLNCGNACPASLPPSSLIGKFTFGVRRG